MASTGVANLSFDSTYVIDNDAARLTDNNGDRVVVSSGAGNFTLTATGTIAPATVHGTFDQTIAAVTQVATGQAPSISGAFTQTIAAFTFSAEGLLGGFTIPEDVTSPVISGTMVHGWQWTCTTGSWGTAVPLSYSYQWRRAGANISRDANDSIYRLQQNDFGNLLACLVTATTADTTLEQLSNETLIDSSPGHRRSRYRKVVGMHSGGTAVFNWTNEE